MELLGLLMLLLLLAEVLLEVVLLGVGVPGGAAAAAVSVIVGHLSQRGHARLPITDRMQLNKLGLS